MRLKAVESIHQESSNISRTFDTVDENQPEVTKRLQKERTLINETKEMLVNAVKEVQELVASL